MKLFGLDIRRVGAQSETKNTISLNTLLRNLEAIFQSASGEAVTPDTAMQSPTVRSIVTNISNAVSTMPVRVMRRQTVDGRVRVVEEPKHPINLLLAQPNAFQNQSTFWMDAVSWLLRYGNYYAIKGAGRTGPVRELTPIVPSQMTPELTESMNLVYKHGGGDARTYTADQVLHIRLSARNGYMGDSPIMDIREAIGFEIAAEKMGASVFGNSAAPGMVFTHDTSLSDGFASEEEARKFLKNFHELYGKTGRFKAMMLPFGMKLDTVDLDLEKAQFLASRAHQRTVIAGAFGVPPNFVGDMSQSSFNNVEQSGLNLLIHVLKPIVCNIQASLERALLSEQDRANGFVIRFDFDMLVPADFKSRQEARKIQREAGVLSPNDWREQEGMNPIEDPRANDYWFTGPSGQGMNDDETPEEAGADAREEISQP